MRKVAAASAWKESQVVGRFYLIAITFGDCGAVELKVALMGA